MLAKRRFSTNFWWMKLFTLRRPSVPMWRKLYGRISISSCGIWVVRSHSEQPGTRITQTQRLVSSSLVPSTFSSTFQNLAKQSKAKTMFATGETVGLAEWIIDDTCLVIFTVRNCRSRFNGSWKTVHHQGGAPQDARPRGVEQGRLVGLCQ